MMKAYFLKITLVLMISACWLMPATSGSAPVHLVDAAGKRLTLDTLPERIVVVGAAPFIPLHMLYMFDETRERLTGFEVKVFKDDEFLSLVDPAFSSKATLKTNPGPESVAAMKPDLVISKSTVSGNLEKSLKPLGIPVMYVGAETADMFLKDIENIGQVLGNPQRAAAIIQYYRNQLSMIRERVKDVPTDQQPSVLVLEYSNRGRALNLNVPAPAWIQTRQALIAGGRPVWLGGMTVRDGWQVTGFEQIASWNPDVIYLIVWYQLNGSDVLQSLYGDPKWRALKAAEHSRLHLFPQDIYGWDSASPRWILGALWMAKMNYPKRFADLDIRRAVQTFYQILYRLDDTIIRTRLIPETI